MYLTWLICYNFRCLSRHFEYWKQNANLLIVDDPEVVPARV